MAKRWINKPEQDKHEVETLSAAINLNKTLTGILIQRGIKSYDVSKKFFRPQYENLHDPFIMKGMATAVERIENAFKNNEKILIYGDYDVDGTTSVALVSGFFGNLYPNIDYYIPDRYTEGYGISFMSIDWAAKNNFSLIIALDCGIKAVDKVKYAKDRGIDFIICDHHLPGDEVPIATAVLNPSNPIAHILLKNFQAVELDLN